MNEELSRRAFLQVAALAAAAGCEDAVPPPGDATVDAMRDVPDPMDATAADTPDAAEEGWSPVPASTEPDPNPRFAHGVVSGDPLPDAVVLWTRVTPDAGAMAPVEVRWELAEDPGFTQNPRGGMARADPSRDFTVKVDATGLAPARTYYYRFSALGATSPVGRTRTAPLGATARLRLAVVSCASYAHGYFFAYRQVARLADLDAVVHLGDYIYEYGNGEYGGVRTYDPPTECRTLADYRRRYAHYRRDPDVRAVHRQHPMIAIWDDHEFADNAWQGGAENHDPATEGRWTDRRAAATQAWFEWMPTRDSPDGRSWRSLAFGDLAELVLLDTRSWGREEQPAFTDGGVATPDRQLLGADQERWLGETVRASRARWKLVGQQVMMTRVEQFVNVDQWDGYPAARARFFGLLREMGVSDVVVLTGDIHSSWGADLVERPRDPMAYDPATGRGSVGVELVTPAVSAPGFPDLGTSLLTTIRASNPQFKFVDLSRRGFILLDVTPERLQAAWHLLDGVSERTARTRLGGVLAVRSGRPTLFPESAPAEPRRDAPPLLP